MKYIQVPLFLLVIIITITFGNIAYSEVKVIVKKPETRFNPFTKPTRKKKPGRTVEVIDCKLSDWSKWGLCSSDCGGKSMRSRKIIRTPANGGKACPSRKEIIQYKKCKDAPYCKRLK